MVPGDLSVAIYVMSCDKNADLVALFLRGLERYWPDCPFRIYVGMNVLRTIDSALLVEPLLSHAAGWRSETLEQLSALRAKAPGISHLLVFLDDFVLREPVDTKRIAMFVQAAAQEEIGYVRLTPAEEGVVGRLMRRRGPSRLFGEVPAAPIRHNHPYVSSLQVALWQRDYLERKVRISSDIWNFEGRREVGVEHYSVLEPLLVYRHVVEKSEWDIGAKEYCLRHLGHFSPGNRRFRQLRLGRARIWLRRLWFVVFGYAGMRSRQWARNVFRNL